MAPPTCYIEEVFSFISDDTIKLVDEELLNNHIETRYEKFFENIGYFLYIRKDMNSNFIKYNDIVDMYSYIYLTFYFDKRLVNYLSKNDYGRKYLKTLLKKVDDYTDSIKEMKSLTDMEKERFIILLEKVNSIIEEII